MSTKTQLCFKCKVLRQSTYPFGSTLTSYINVALLLKHHRKTAKEYSYLPEKIMVVKKKKQTSDQ